MPVISPPLPADALWAGVPVITLPGQHMAARVAATLVTLHLRRASDAIKSLFVVRNFDEFVRARVEWPPATPCPACHRPKTLHVADSTAGTMHWLSL